VLAAHACGDEVTEVSDHHERQAFRTAIVIH
jgi:hypothetical protein